MCTPLLNAALSSVDPYIRDWLEPISGQQMNLKSLILGKLKIEDVQIKQKVLEFVPLPIDLESR